MKEKRKNVLFVLTDDQGAWAMGCAGNSELKTPNLDRLAASGIRFENLYCVSPVCSPARASLLTGKIPSQHGVHDWLAKGQITSDCLSDELKQAFAMDDPPFKYRWPKNQLNNDVGIRYLDGHKTFTEVLAENGYECGLSGKWHIGAADEPQAGFSFWSTCAIGGADYINAVVLKNGKMELLSGEYITDYITDRALDFLGQRDKEKPFCLCVNYTAPHSPWGKECHPKKYIDMYDGCPFDSIPNLPPHPWVEGADTSFEDWKKVPHPGVRFLYANYAPIKETWQEYRRESLRGYFAAVSAMDEALGRLLDRLEADGLAEDTLVVFTSDNGSNMGHHGIFGKGNGTYPVNMYETSTRVPGLFSCPGTIPSGVVAKAKVSHYDIFHTVLDFVGVPFQKTDDMPGESFAPLLCGKADPDRGGDVFVFDEYGVTRMATDRDWKLVLRSPDGPNELYNLKDDPDEYINRYDDPKCAEIIQSLGTKLAEWFDKYIDPELDGSKEDVRGHGQITSHMFK